MYIITDIFIAIAALGIAWPMLHIFQLEGYVIGGTFSWIRKNLTRFFSWNYIILVIIIATYILCGGIMVPSIAFAFAVIAGICAAWSWIAAVKKTSGKELKKKLHYTKRMKRLAAATIGIWLVLAIVALLETAVLIALVLVAPLLALIAGWVTQPIEKAINMSFFNDAKVKIAARDDLIKIGITGSFGKTSTKFILAALLSEKYNVLATQSSFNTPMGLTRVIRERLLPEHEVFIAEMGARHVGDIAELCELVKPTYGLITSVGKQHLETFFSLENITKTKYELIEGLPSDGAAFFADDGAIVRGMWQKTQVEKTLSGFADDCAVTARDISVGENGSSFTLCSGGESIEVTTKLLGRHNISNILLCCAAAIKLGVSLLQIKTALQKLEPVEHRLQLIKGAKGLTVIDDAFNSNPSGAKAALDVIREFKGRRVIITPGMVELGDEEEALNREFGRQMAASVDTAILLGKKRSEPIKQGLLEKGFPGESIIVADTLNEATAVLHKYAGAGDVVLFENDLPDNY